MNFLFMAMDLVLAIVTEFQLRLLRSARLKRYRSRVIQKRELLTKLHSKQQIQKALKDIQSIGSHCQFNGNCWTIIQPKKLLIGNNVHLGNNLYIHAGGSVSIGDNTHISHNVVIYSANYDYESSALPFDQRTVHKPVIIGRNVWIGMNVCITPGVNIGDGAIIGMGTVVSKSIHDYEIVGTAPQRLLKIRDTESYNRLDREKAYSGRNGKPLSHLDIQTFKSSYADNRIEPIVFILGTGRSGSQAIVDTLNQGPRCLAFHEAIRQFIRLSTELAHKNVTESDAYTELENIFKNKKWEATKGELIIHSDQRLWNFVPFLASYFPNAKFIHLIRDPYSATRSMAARHWFDDKDFELHLHDWSLYRLSPVRMELLPLESWVNMKIIDRCLWYWLFVNQKIEEALLKLPEERRQFIALNNLSQSMPDLFKFLNLEGQPVKALKTNIVKDKHVSQYQSLNKEIFTDEHLIKELKQYIAVTEHKITLKEII